MTAPYTPLAVANEFIRFAGASGIDHMKLHKLAYYVQGMSCAAGNPAINEFPEVWKYGPVFPSLYYELKYHGGNAITRPERDNLVGVAPTIAKSDLTTTRLVHDVWRALGGTTAIQLSQRTHRVGTPWNQIATKHNWRVPRHTQIPENLLKEYFRSHGLNG